ncbi:hypothetical protein VCUG_00771 [Vavraia culicis subsp. floridensis]|uniref:Large ribosomal subunit protein uL15/eL18 domain-containing protein n=1 Tax=Vavraia culicis (isolate floridensis) TaxID=948595 RepID=L2GVM4_VAVCU|nr:uncharacterized protein VCUG_00771 [Vavraia culicis subsp. floridensis]ELA47689.1 hypothetical protein VCUG_00771 [Vavraia culicis subsp. floridensis]
MSRNNRQPVKVARLAEHAGKVIVVVGKVLDSERVFTLPKLTIVALTASREARRKVKKFGGEIYTLDKLFKVSSDLKNVVLVCGDRTKRKAYRYFGAAGEKNSLTYPRTTNRKNSGEKRINFPKKRLIN